MRPALKRERSVKGQSAAKDGKFADFAFLSPRPSRIHWKPAEREFQSDKKYPEQNSPWPSTWFCEDKPSIPELIFDHANNPEFPTPTVAPSEYSNIFREFRSLDPDELGQFATFASKYGFLCTPCTGFMGTPDYHDRECPAAWKWHVTRLKFIAEISDACLSVTRQGKQEAAKRISKIIYDPPQTRTLCFGDPDTLDLTCGNEQYLAPEYPLRFHRSPTYCIEHEFMDRKQFHGLTTTGRVSNAETVINYSETLINHALARVFLNHGHMIVDVRNGTTDVSPKTTLGAIYWTLFRSFRDPQIDLRFCKGCGEPFYPKRRDQWHCKIQGTTDLCRKRAQLKKKSAPKTGQS